MGYNCAKKNKMTKKIFVTAALFIGMIAGAMVFSSFDTPKQKVSKEFSSITKGDGWNMVGSYFGYDREGNKSSFPFVIWEKAGMCNAYYWTYDHYTCGPIDPDRVKSIKIEDTGALRKNSEGKWYAAHQGTNWFIDF